MGIQQEQQEQSFEKACILKACVLILWCLNLSHLEHDSEEAEHKYSK